MNSFKRQLFLDTETTGLVASAGHRLFEIGCVEMINRQLTGNTFHCYLNPERDIENPEITGVTLEFLKDKPRFSEVAEKLYQFIQGAVLIAHNAPFDIGFLEHEFSLIGTPYGKVTDFCEVIDTLVLARRLHPGQRNNLDALSKRYNITHFDRTYHGALLDAKILAQVYLAMTVGQTSLQGLEIAEEPCQLLGKISGDTEDGPVPVLKVTPDEQAKHQEFLQLLRKNSGKPVEW